MHPDGWRLTEDLDAFLTRTTPFLRSRPALHTVPLTVTGTLRTHGPKAYGTEAPLFGWLEQGGQVEAVLFHTPPHRLNLTPLTPGDAGSLAVRLAAAGHHVPGVSAEHMTATAFAAAWRRHTAAAPVLHECQRLYRLDALTPPAPLPPGRPRTTGADDHERLRRWKHEFGVAVGDVPPTHSASVSASASAAVSWADTYFADRFFTFWETDDGTPVSMAGVSPMLAGQVRVAPVYTPPGLRGHGYAGAVTAEVSRAARTAGAKEVVLFADLANPTSNALYQRIGYRPVTDFALYDFPSAAP
ncbi:GNAT family N-acetyltransferase [Streptomyces sp. NPDC047000]|uniref:GNAT family N-acetyltransferase n=1 Tax=Streptomyces sp. NPDC047000 TaxID=3155474 RepID=UPI0033DD5071